MVAASSSAQELTDPWDLPPPPTSSRRRAPHVVPDAWDDDDDDDDEPDEPLTQRNQRIWDNANAKAPAPMPTVISTTSSHPALSPPPGAFQPTMRILKRPTSNQNSESETSPVNTALNDGLKEREAKYLAARQRIFGQKSGEESVSNPGINSDVKISPQSPRSNGWLDKEQAQERRGPLSGSGSVIRDPRGPAISNSDSSTPEDLAKIRGFQRPRPKPTTTIDSNDSAGIPEGEEQ